MVKVLVSNVRKFLGTPIVRVLARNNPEYSVFAHDPSFSDSGSTDDFFEQLDLGPASALNVKPIFGSNVEEIVSQVDNQVDILINNDGYEAIRNPIENISKEEFMKTLEELTVFPFTLTTSVVKEMQKKKQGKIIFITSATPFRGLPNYSSYCIARGATNTMALTFAQELARYNIQVNAVAPNFIESPTYFPQHLLDDPETYKKIVKPIPLKRLGKPEEPAELVAFLASNKADYITGQIMPYAGGWC